jgi:hypothetical protein
MAIRREDGELLMECDGCGEAVYGGVLEFAEFVRRMQEVEGWRVRKVEDAWEHTCRECSE